MFIPVNKPHMLPILFSEEDMIYKYFLYKFYSPFKNKLLISSLLLSKGGRNSELKEKTYLVFCKRNVFYLSIFLISLTSEEDFRWCSGIPRARGMVEIKAKDQQRVK